jgi:hypothetical protein
LFALLQGWFKKKRKSEKVPGKLENSGKTESAFFLWERLERFGYFFLMFVIILMRFLCKKKIGKVARKIGKFGKN